MLVIDRTNWKFGSTDINIFMLAVAHEGVDNPRKGDRAKAHWLFQGLKVGQTMCLPRIHYIKGQACYLSAGRVKGRDGAPELGVIVSFNRHDEAVETYRRRWEIETMFRALKSAGFNIEDTHLTDLDRIGKLLLLVMIAFVRCYDVGEYVHRNIREIKVKKHGRKAKSIFRYGLDIVTEFLLRDRNDYGIPIPAFLSIANPLAVRC